MGTSFIHVLPIGDPMKWQDNHIPFVFKSFTYVLLADVEQYYPSLLHDGHNPSMCSFFLHVFFTGAAWDFPL